MHHDQVLPLEFVFDSLYTSYWRLHWYSLEKIMAEVEVYNSYAMVMVDD